MLGVRLDKQLENRLTVFSAKTRRSKSYLAKEVLRKYIAEEELKQQENEIALARWEEYEEFGEVVANLDVVEWLDSWGEEHEKPFPER